MVTSAGIKVLDFGLAKFANSELPLISGVTGTQIILGTPSYMSPEQTRGEQLDARSDVFSMACLLYEAATGVRPFRGSSVPDILPEIVSRNPAPASSLRPELPRGWDDILQRVLAKDRNRRCQSAAELFQVLEELRSRPQQPLAPRMEERQPGRSLRSREAD